MSKNLAKKIFAGLSAAAVTLTAFPAFVSAAAHPVGTNVNYQGTVWMVYNGGSGVCRRAYTSAGAFLSYGFNSWGQVVEANADDLALPVCSEGFIPPQDGGIIFSDRGADKGTGYAISGAMKYGFTTEAAFKGQGYSYANATWADVSWMSSGGNISDGAAAHVVGALINNAGTVQLVGNSGLMGIPDIATFNSWGYSFAKVVPANGADKAKAQTGVMAMRMAGQLSPTAMTTIPTQQNGPVMAMLSSNTPASSTLVAGQATADLSHFTFTGNGVVTKVVLQRLGVSADATASNVFLFDGVTRLTDAASVDNTGKVTFSAPAGLFTVSGSKTIAVKSDIALNTAGQTLGMGLATFDVAAMTTTANINGNIHSIASATLATVSHGTTTPSGAILNPGPSVTVWQDTLTISNRDVKMKRIAFRNTGSAPAASFTNFKLFVNGTQAGSAAMVDINGYVTFDLSASPVMLVTGSRVVRVDADIISGASRTVQFSLRNAADVDFVDSSFNVNITPTSTPWAPSAASTISGTSGGTLTIQKDTTSPSTNVVLAGSDVVLGVYKLTAYGESIKVETITPGFTFTDGGAANAAATLRNGRVLMSTDGSNWVQYGSTATLAPAGTSYTTNYTVVPGTPVWLQIRADIFDNDGTGTLDTSDTLLARLVTGASNAQRIDSLGSFNAPAASVDANTLTIASGAMTLSKNTTYANQTTTLPVTNYKVGSWTLSGSSVEDILITTLSFDIDEVSGAEFDQGDMTNVYPVVKNGATVVAQPSPFATVGAADNNFSINYTLPKNQNLTIELFANLSDDGLIEPAGASDAIDTDDSVKTDLTVSGTALVGGTAVTATSADTDGQTIAYGSATLTASVDATSPVLAIVTDNQTITSGAYKFSAVTAGFNVTDVTLTIPAAGATSVTSVMLYDGAQLIGTQPGGAATVTFSGLSCPSATPCATGFYVGANTTKVLTVKLALGTVGLGAGTSAGSLLTTMTTFTAVNVSTGVSDASAADAGPSIESPANPAAAAQYVFAAIPTITQGSVSTALINAVENDLYKFTVTPNGGNIALKQLKFTVVTNDNVGTNDTLTVGSFKLFRGGTDITTNVDIHNTAGATIESTNSLAEGTTTAIVTWATEEQISVATEFTLKATPTGFSTAADDDYINVTLAYDSSMQTAANSYLIDLDNAGATQVTVGLASSTGTALDDAIHGTDAATVTDGPNVVWSDISALPHSETVVDAGSAATSSADWYNGYLIQSMPLSGITKNN